MKYVITAHTLLSRHYLEVTDRGVTFYDPKSFSFTTGKRRFTFFADIVGVILSPDSQLSFQVGTEVFTIKVNPLKPKHRDAMQALVGRLELQQKQPPAA